MFCSDINIWEDKDYKGILVDGKAPYMKTYILEGSKQRPCVLILPGGGYGYLSESEAEPIALKFTQEGYMYLMHRFLKSLSFDMTKMLNN